MRRWIIASILLLGAVLSARDAAAQNSEGKALIVVDVQGCFLPGGTMPTRPADGTLSLISNINTLRIAGQYEAVVFTQDWHPKGHISFAATHNKKPLDQITLKYTANGQVCSLQGVYPGAASTACRSGDSTEKLPEQKIVPVDQLPQVKHILEQVLWPEHCVQNTQEARLHPGLLVKPTDILLRKGSQLQLDSYSAFEDNGGIHSTGLADTLRKRGIRKTVIVGVALDYCVLYTAIDAVKAGFDTSVVLDATAPVSEAAAADAIGELQQAGVHVLKHAWDAVHTYGPRSRRALIN